MTSTIISWNINSICSKFPFLQTLVHDYDPTAICLQETKLAPTSKISFKGYTIIRKDQQSPTIAKGGVAIAIKSSIEFEEISLNTDFQAVAIRVLLPTTFTLCSLYLHKDKDVRSTDLHQLINLLPRPFLLTGDFNGHNRIWGSDSDSPRGIEIERFLNSSPTVLLNTGTATHFNCYTGTSSSIDLTISSDSIGHILHWSSSNTLYSSDHYPQIIQMQLNLPPPTFSPKWKLQSADWESFSNLLDLTDAGKFNDVNDLNNFITSKIIQAAENSIPKTSIRPQRKAVPWWNSHCKAAIKLKNQLLIQAKRHPTFDNLQQFKLARARARQIIYQNKRKSWQDFVSTINSKTPVTALWQRIRKICPGNSFLTISAIKRQNGGLTSQIHEIVDEIAKYYFSQFENHRPPLPIHTISITDVNTNSEAAYNRPIQISELTDAIKTLRNTAAGPDNIHPFMLKHTTPAHHQQILHLYNTIWLTGKLPIQWREAIILPIHKTGKNLHDPSSFRPISLTNVLCKLIEKIIVKRLRTHLEQNAILEKYQSGFRQNRSTVDNIIRLQQSITEGIHNREYTIAVFFDLEKAFDSIQPQTIINALTTHQISGRLLHFVREFLSLRSFRVRVGSVHSDDYPQSAGVPQGSVISPLLFLLAINDIGDQIQQGIDYAVFADDLVIYSRSKNLEVTEKKLQSCIKELETWANKRGLKFSASKTKYMNFTRKRFHQPLRLILNDEEIACADTIQFLGMTLDKALTWRQHISKLKQKCFTRLNLLKALRGKTWGADQKTLLRIYSSHIRSILDYGCTAYSTAAPSRLKQLDVIQNQALRIATGAFYTSPIHSLHADTSIFPLHYRRHYLLLKYFASINRQATHINLYKIKSAAENNYKKPTLLGTTIKQLLRTYNIETAELLPTRRKDPSEYIYQKITLQLQVEWNQSKPSLLLKIKPRWQKWKANFRTHRREEIVLTRLRIGHSPLTHQYILDRDSPPLCSCKSPLTIPHILDSCEKFQTLRRLMFPKQPVTTNYLTNNIDFNNTILKFLRLSSLYDKM